MDKKNRELNLEELDKVSGGIGMIENFGPHGGNNQGTGDPNQYNYDENAKPGPNLQPVIATKN